VIARGNQPVLAAILLGAALLRRSRASNSFDG
jgi:hypothetical protein